MKLLGVMSLFGKSFKIENRIGLDSNNFAVLSKLLFPDIYFPFSDDYGKPADPHI